ncbi:Nlp7 protein, partial [Globisporangium splendens]
MALYPQQQQQQLSTDDVLMGEILISLKRHAVVQREVTSSASYRSKVDLTVQMPTRQETEDAVAASFASLSTVSPVASSAYALVAPSHSPSERTKRYGPVVQLDDLRKCFNMPIAAVARKFGICATLLKKICRRHGIQRWPHRQIRSLQKSIDMLRESLAVAKGSNKEYIAKKIAAFEYTLECIMQDPNTAAKGISAGRLASPATEELVKRNNRAKSRTQKLQLSSASALAAALSEDDDMDDMEDEDEALQRTTVASPLATYVQHAEERNVGMSLKSILC